MPGETAQAICCMIFGGVLERYPKLKVCFAHGGKQNEFVQLLDMLNYVSGHRHQFHLSVWRVGSEILLLQDTLSATASPTSTKDQ